MKLSKNCQQIAHVLKSERLHPTAEELHIHMKEAGYDISLATVYRCIKQLCDGGYIARLSIPDSPDRFDAINDGHNHMICTECGAICDLPPIELGELCSLLPSEREMTVTDVKMTLYGICKQCKTYKAKGV